MFVHTSFTSTTTSCWCLWSNIWGPSWLVLLLLNHMLKLFQHSDVHCSCCLQGDWTAAARLTYCTGFSYFIHPEDVGRNACQNIKVSSTYDWLNPKSWIYTLDYYFHGPPRVKSNAIDICKQYIHIFSYFNTLDYDFANKMEK